MNEQKTHYRNVFKSDHLGVADLEEMIESKKPLKFTIKEVKQEIDVMVAGRKGSHNIAYFKESIKPLVLNATNSKMIRLFTKSPFVQDWSNVAVDLYIDSSVKMKGEVVGGVRLRVNGLDQSDMLLKELIALHKEFGGYLNSEDAEGIERVINNKESNLYAKCISHLKSFQNV